MKTMFKSLFVAVLFTGLGSTAFAQLGAQETINVSARILKQITLTKFDIKFGRVAAGGGLSFLDPTGASSVNVGAAAEPGRLIIDASAEEAIKVEFPSYVVMTINGDPILTATDSITYIPFITVAHDSVGLGDAAQGTSIEISNTAIPIAGPFPVTGAGGTGFGPEGIVTTAVGSSKVTLFIGGNLYLANGAATSQVPSNQTTGDYEADLLFNVLYAN